ncbi:E3 ubiquitin-protein ligase SHPRH, partial [Schistosoma bovis]
TRIYSKATLIISPDHIWQQWKEELQTHVIPDALQVLIYAGMEAPVTSVEFGIRGSVKEQGNNNPFAPRIHVPTKVLSENKVSEETILPGFVQPPQLACADIVLTSYSVVQRELDWAEICLDEAQMVERVTSRTARMLSQVTAVNRWCVTGTPAEKSIDDLFGLFAYLRLTPYSFSHYWNSLLYQPFLAACSTSSGKNHYDSNDNVKPVVFDKSLIASTDLSKILTKLLWRNTKALVGDQLAIPPLTEEIHWITFTPVERYIHDRVLAQSAGALERLVQNMSISPDQSLCSLPTAAHWRLVYLITRLRQACTHPSLVVATCGSHKGNRSDGNQTGRVNGLTTSQIIPNMVRVGLNDDEQYSDNGEDYSRKMNNASTLTDARAHRNLGTGNYYVANMHSQLLAKVRENLDPIVEELDNELRDPTKQGSNENLTDRMATVDAGGWLSWLTEAIDFLIVSGLGHSLIDMLVASFQSRPNMNRSGF